MEERSPKYYFDLTGFAHRELFENVESVWQVLEQIGSYLMSHPLGALEGEISEGAWLVDRETIFIGKGSVVEPGAYIKGPCWIGENCTIRQGAYIRGNLVAGDHVVIGHTTEVKNALFLNGAQAAHFAYVGDSVLGNNVNLGAGTKLANLKLDGRNVCLRLHGERVDSGLRKFGAILGDRVQLGCNSVTNPGTLMGPDSACLPCCTVRGVVPKGKCVKGERHATSRL